MGYSESDLKHDEETLKNLELFRSPSGFRRAMPKLISSVRKGPGKRDWVTMQYIAGGYQQMSRKLSSAGGLEEEENQTLKLVVATYKMAESIYQSWLESGGDTLNFPQLKYAMSRTTVLRHWGDALNALGLKESAEEIYEIGVSENLWTKIMCRPEKQLETIEAGGSYFYEIEEVLPDFVVEGIKESLKGIRTEFMKNVKEGKGVETWKVESSGLHSTHTWFQLPFYVDGDSKPGACGRYPLVCEVYDGERFPAARKGQIKLSAMAGGTVVRKHAGPTMERLRMHCSVVGEVGDDSWIRVGDEKRSWEVGECFIFDESCEHEVFIGGVGGDEKYRVVLIADLANPLLVNYEDYREASKGSKLAEVGGSRLYEETQDRFMRKRGHDVPEL
ncbi:hypothetical protein TrST_g1825 [Triparma strigata]|uniref:Aspartyl/asparaginy/proline hydroxylase domain-containing protein n=1 Tax=Triparma strigata TaxID=1606541 RepID=A0A9W7BXX7_9STRA|nr:hypothetical protein TrST_g1825 [Triparma strigata]